MPAAEQAPGLLAHAAPRVRPGHAPLHPPSPSASASPTTPASRCWSTTASSSRTRRDSLSTRFLSPDCLWCVSASHLPEQPDPSEGLGGGGERIWKLLAYMKDLQLLMDPDDLLLLKSQLAIRSMPDGTDASFCFQPTGHSPAVLHATNATRDIKKRVPWVIGVEVDSNGGLGVQEADMRLYHGRRRGAGDDAGKIELLQAFQAVEAAVRRFFFAYQQQVVAAVCDTTEASGNRALFVPASSTFWFDTKKEGSDRWRVETAEEGGNHMIIATLCYLPLSCGGCSRVIGNACQLPFAAGEPDRQWID